MAGGRAVKRAEEHEKKRTRQHRDHNRPVIEEENAQEKRAAGSSGPDQEISYPLHLRHGADSPQLAVTAKA